MSLSLIACLELPQACQVDKPLFKKQFSENGKLEASENKILASDVERIVCKHVIKAATAGIAAYLDEEREYGEIVTFSVALRESGSEKRIARMFYKSIPYPVIIDFEHEGRHMLALAQIRNHLKDSSRWLVEREWSTHWIDPQKPSGVEEEFMKDLSISRQHTSNLFTLHQDWRNRIAYLSIATVTGAYHRNPLDEAALQLRLQILEQIERLNQQVGEITRALKGERQIGRRIEMSGQLDRISTQIEALKGNL